MLKLAPKQIKLINILENFDKNKRIMVLCDIANINEDHYKDKLEMLETYRSITEMTESSDDDFIQDIHNFAYSRYRDLRLNLGPDAMLNVELFKEEDDKDDKDDKDNKDDKDKKSDKDEKEYDQSMAPLVKAIKSKGDSQANVAHSLGVDPSTISRIKHGVRDPSFDLLQKMANKFGKGIISKLVG